MIWSPSFAKLTRGFTEELHFALVHTYEALKECYYEGDEKEQSALRWIVCDLDNEVKEQTATN